MKARTITLVAFVFMFIVPSIIQLGTNTVSTNIELSKNYTESYTHHDAIWIQSNAEFDAQAASESWPGDGSKENPYVITGYLFDCETQPLRIWHTTVHWKFAGNEIFGVGSNIQCGAWIENVTNGAIVGNEIHNRHSGLAITDVKDFLIRGNTIHDCWGRGIDFFGAMNTTIIDNNVIHNIDSTGIYSSLSIDSLIANNTISYCADIGIALMGITSNCVIINNRIQNCDLSGALIIRAIECDISENVIANVSDQGLYISSLDSCVITNNTISDVSGDGLRFSVADFCVVSENVIANCTENGLLLSSGTNTTVEWNTVTNTTNYAVNLGSGSTSFVVKFNAFTNNGGICQIRDDGTTNIVSQNYYDDWNTPDVDANGYVDTPYVFEGDANNQDDFPLAVEGVVPTTTEPNTTNGDDQLPLELILIAGTTGAIILVAGVYFLKKR
jgi:parallel beta-helix repeat protein